MVRWMQRFFQYLDRFYVDLGSIASLTDQGFSQFKSIIFGRLLSQITDTILKQVDRDRQREPVDLDMLRETVSIYVFLSQEKIVGISLNCLADLEGKFLNASRTFFAQMGDEFRQSGSLVNFLEKSIELLHLEKKRLADYMSWSDIDAKIILEFN